ncbi:hypothetical protein BS47DRAFT_1353800 [Hydnum rufescens UP504]|uniref:Pirin n=1 Tax=Hydnum rufescens UP504 TaxID=1448309 RepID=A0A9P6AH23_9AGAM|nr:hypothetical protein BS47DRAFT_1353800 [Hydnum rufescens UP504]
MSAATLVRSSRSVVKKVFAVDTPEGRGALVRRSIGSRQLKNVSPFLMIPDHPHRGQATVTYMVEGSFQHEDSEGHRGIISTGDVQWMIAKSDFINLSSASTVPIHGPGLPNPTGLQLWVDLPKQHKMTTPSYQELKAEGVRCAFGIPSAFPNGPDGPEIKIVSGKSHGVESPVRSLSGCWYFRVLFNKKGQSIFQDIPPGWTAFVYTFKGSVQVGSSSQEAESTVHDKYHTLVLSTGSNESGVQLTAATDDAQVFLYGPFVMTSQEEIDATVVDFQTGRNGFEKAGKWKSEIGKSMRG